MSEKQIERCIKNATFSLEMEGFSVDEQTKEWCRRLLNEEITMEEYLTMAKAKAGVTA
ncbi:MAG: hypothetical protein IKM48_01215 [Clostridia bacterium]|nr:hypothetical protein [Clostridia bacterium]MBR6792960.1 hypothetical protein [Clostridia bacterium]